MSQPTLFCDRAALVAHRARARAGGSGAGAGAWFLHDRACAEIKDRLAEVNRRFTDPAVIGPRARETAQALGVSAVCLPDEDTLDLKRGAHDLVIHAFGLHWANDPVGQLIQMRRALRPDGLMIAVLFAGETLRELRAALTTAEAGLRGGLTPRIAPMADLRALGGLLQRAGYALPVADADTVRATYGDAFGLMRDLRAMGETNALSARERRFAPRALFAQADRAYSAGRDSAGRIPATFQLAYLTGWAPADSQQQPLRPGSARTRLADALGVPELNPEKGQT